MVLDFGDATAHVVLPKFDRHTFAPSKEAVDGLPANCELPQHPCLNRRLF